MTYPIHSDEGPQCPHCNCVITPDENHYYDEQRYTQDECPECGKMFSVRVEAQVSWICAPIEEKEEGKDGFDLIDELKTGVQLNQPTKE
jgi:predicted RNA-binding Zn-ribbon protein involved in translation (DUF1610 family)